MPYSSILDFGRHAGVSLFQLPFRDPDWLFWALESGAFEGRECGMWAPEICDRARRIRIPGHDSHRPLVAEYTERGNRLVHVELVPEDHPVGRASHRLKWLDLSYARFLRGGMDKRGSQLVVRATKHAWFGNESARIDQDGAKAFFSDASHFFSAPGGDSSYPGVGRCGERNGTSNDG